MCSSDLAPGSSEETRRPASPYPGRRCFLLSALQARVPVFGQTLIRAPLSPKFLVKWLGPPPPPALQIPATPPSLDTPGPFPRSHPVPTPSWLLAPSPHTGHVTAHTLGWRLEACVPHLRKPGLRQRLPVQGHEPAQADMGSEWRPMWSPVCLRGEPGQAGAAWLGSHAL